MNWFETGLMYATVVVVCGWVVLKWVTEPPWRKRR
jgi:hypothetical protein